MKTRTNLKTWLLMSVFLLSIASLARADWVEQAKLLASDGAAGDWFGQSVHINTGYCLVGAVFDDSERGSAYIFKRDPNTGSWSQQVKLTASDGVAGDRFGVSIWVDGDYCIGGAYNDDSIRGSAYIFKRDPNTDNWSEQTKLTASDGAAGDQFGNSVSMDGDHAIVGAIYDDDKGTHSGSAYIFKRSDVPGDPNWYEQAKLLASDGAFSDHFATCVSINGDYAIVGAPLNDDKGSNSGSAYIFKRDGESWVEQQKLVASDGTAGDRFGHSVSIGTSGAYCLIGADEYYNDATGSAYVFTRDGESWTEQAKLTALDGAAGDRFGASVSMDINSGYCLIGADEHDKGGIGSAYIFKLDGTSWIQQAKLAPSDGADGDRFGARVSINGDSAIVSAVWNDDNGTDSGSAYIFTLTIAATIDIDPDTLNLNSKGRWITCCIWLPEEYNVADIDSYTVFLENEIQAEWVWFDEQEQIAMAKFSRSDLQNILEPGEVELTVTGELIDGTKFEGIDTIIVIDKGGKK